MRGRVVTVDVPPLLGPRGRPFTPQQAGAVLDDEGALLLSANAGSGKTSVLVERFVRHVEQGIAPARILAITFTEKAAGELAARVRERLLELGLRDAAREAEAAWISTVHGFCARVLRAHAVAAGLDPGFAILDEATARGVRDDAWRTAFAAWLDADPVHLDLAAALTVDGLRAAVGDVHDALRSAGQTVPRLPVPAEPAPVPDPAALRAARDAAASFLASASAGDGRRVEEACDALDRCRDLLDALEPPADPSAGERPYPAGARLPALPAPGALAVAKVGRGANALKGPACDAYREALDAYASAVADFRALEAAHRLDALLQGYADAYAAAKRARSALDFDDLELRARDLLRDAPAVRATYAERFDRWMVDEFQDSNPLQVELFGLVAGGRHVTVGDEQQAIYGFRHADVEVFRARRRMLEPDGRVRELPQNFRSRAQILGTLNAIFGGRGMGGFEPLVGGRPDEPGKGVAAPAAHAAQGRGEPLVELLLTGTDGWDDVDLGGTLPRAQRWRQAEARLLAQRIRDLVDAGEAAPEEVVVLLRALGDLPVFERALQDQGLQTVASGGRGYWARQVVRDLTAWLAALANPRDEEQLYGVLASPLVGLGTDGLAAVAAEGPGSAWRAIEDGSALARIVAASDAAAASGAPPGADRASGAPASDRERLTAFRERFAAERALLPRLGLDEVLARAVQATDYDLHVLRLPGGPRRLANVHKLIRLAAEHERAFGRDVRGLVDRARAELEADAREADAPVELGDQKAVRLMSIHAAKGLQFPVVCVADLGRRTSSDAPVLLVRDGRLGLKLPCPDGSFEKALDYERLLDRRRAADADEEERVVYVALTRAEERLILSGGVSLERWPNEGVGAPPLSWLGPAILGEGCSRAPDAANPVRDLAWAVNGFEGRARVALNTPATVGRVLRDHSRAPAGAALAPTPPPPVRPPLPPPAAPAPGIRALSYSALSLWRRCGYRFYLQRVLRLPDARVPPGALQRDATTGRLDRLLRGTLVHELLEDVELPPPAEEVLRERIAAAAERHAVALGEEDVADLLALVRGFTHSPLAARVAAARTVQRERMFSVPVGDELLNGVVDLLAREDDGGALVVDYKTDRPGEDVDAEAYIEAGYGVQRRAYALAALRAGAPRVEVAHLLLERPAAPVVATYTAADADALEAELLDLSAGPLAGTFEPTPAPHRELCLTCPGRRALCSWGEDMTLRPPEEAFPPAEDPPPR